VCEQTRERKGESYMEEEENWRKSERREQFVLSQAGNGVEGRGARAPYVACRWLLLLLLLLLLLSLLQCLPVSVKQYRWINC